MQKKIRTGESEQNRTKIIKIRSFVYLVFRLILTFRPSTVVYIRMSSLLIVNNLAIFSGSVNCQNVFVKVCGYKNSHFFNGCKNINLICLISVSYLDYRNQSDRLSF